MKVSIITVAYNSVKTIQKTFDSVRNQTYTDIEYIVVDGNSNDGTKDLITANNDMITRWVSEPDQGLYDAMNKGIALATGDVIGILNSDDTFKSNNVVCEVVFFLKNYPHIDACIGNVEIHDKNGKVHRRYQSQKWQPWKLKWGLMPPHPSIFIKPSVYRQFGHFNTQFKIGADFEIITRFFLKEKIPWKYSGITTTSMLEGGLSNGGLKSYLILSKECVKALQINALGVFSYLSVFRGFFKLNSFFK